MKILIFSLDFTATPKIQSSIKAQYVNLNPKKLSIFFKKINHNSPNFIIGFGSYTGIDQDKLRIETVCTNKFRNHFIDDQDLIRIPISEFLVEGSYSKRAIAIGNSWCNYVSYQIARFLTNQNYSTKYGFIHIPQKMNEKLIIQELEHIIKIL